MATVRVLAKINSEDKTKSFTHTHTFFIVDYKFNKKIYVLEKASSIKDISKEQVVQLKNKYGIKYNVPNTYIESKYKINDQYPMSKNPNFSTLSIEDFYNWFDKLTKELSIDNNNLVVNIESFEHESNYQENLPLIKAYYSLYDTINCDKTNSKLCVSKTIPSELFDYFDKENGEIPDKRCLEQQTIDAFKKEFGENLVTSGKNINIPRWQVKLNRAEYLIKKMEKEYITNEIPELVKFTINDLIKWSKYDFFVVPNENSTYIGDRFVVKTASNCFGVKSAIGIDPFLNSHEIKKKDFKINKILAFYSCYGEKVSSKETTHVYTLKFGDYNEEKEERDILLDYQGNAKELALKGIGKNWFTIQNINIPLNLNKITTQEKEGK